MLHPLVFSSYILHETNPQLPIPTRSQTPTATQPSRNILHTKLSDTFNKHEQNRCLALRKLQYIALMSTLLHYSMRLLRWTSVSIATLPRKHTKMCCMNLSHMTRLAVLCAASTRSNNTSKMASKINPLAHPCGTLPRLMSGSSTAKPPTEWAGRSWAGRRPPILLLEKRIKNSNVPTKYREKNPFLVTQKAMWCCSWHRTLDVASR